jgi:hypothetical protein
MAFGNLKFDTLTTSDAKNTNTEKSIDTSYLFNGIAKNWMSATEPGSVGDSFNVSSTSDDGSGIHSVVLTNNMASAAHAAVTGMQDADMACLGESGRASTGYMVTLLQRADSLTRTDGDHFTALFGDLA